MKWRVARRLSWIWFALVSRRLTPREREVFELIVRGQTNKQAANTLGSTERTIKAHRHRVMEKCRSGPWRSWFPGRAGRCLGQRVRQPTDGLTILYSLRTGIGHRYNSISTVGGLSNHVAVLRFDRVRIVVSPLAKIALVPQAKDIAFATSKCCPGRR